MRLNFLQTTKKELKRYRELIEEYYGKKCKEYNLFCGCCIAWRIYDEFCSMFDDIKAFEKQKHKL